MEGFGLSTALTHRYTNRLRSCSSMARAKLALFRVFNIMECKNCGNHFPSSIVIDGKRRVLSSRDYCLICSPFGRHLTRPLEKSLRVCQKVNERGEAIIKCKECGRIYDYTKRKGHSKLYCNSCVVNRKRRSIKQKLVEYKGGKCTVCGYIGCLDVYDFHHKDPNEKDFAINSSRASIKFEKLLKEVDKCDLMCCRCHREEHARQNALLKQQRLSSCS